ncbi:MAG: diaminopimelate decarboxylase [Thermodesulfobacteriota bacterium]|nr:diaminopimelate decarboxylase [Thermodesulfobacteriota bacterium]
MEKRISPFEMAQALKQALEQGLVTERDTSVVFYDLTLLKDRIERLLSLFPKSTLHAIAIKANPLLRVLEYVRGLGNASRLGLEAASWPELELALRAGYGPREIVFDSPAKTSAEIEFALGLGVHLNIDNFQELARVDALIRQRAKRPKGSFGIRVNPQVGPGSIAATSVANEYSKMGIPLDEHRKELIDAFAAFKWLNGVHVHIGSQGCGLDLLVRGVEAAYAFAREVNASLGGERIQILDIGGGLPVSYRDLDNAPGFADYVKALKTSCPGLFGDEFRLVTEFGRTIHAGAGFTASRVEYVKPEKDIHTAIIHVGADMFLRKCYNPEDWHHDLSVADAGAGLKTGAHATYNIAGPLCFAGDILAREIRLPEIKPNDWVLIHDTGAYTLSLWSRCNSRPIPLVLGFERKPGLTFQILKKRQSIQDIIAFWG